MPSSMVYALVMAAVVVLAGAAMASAPWLVRSTECFAVTVPEAMAGDPRLVGLKRRYSATVAVLSAAAAAATGVACLLDPEGAVGAVALLVSTVVLMVASFALMLRYRSRVARLKREGGWRATRQVRFAAVGEADLPRPLSLAWELVHVPIVLLTVGLGVSLLPSMPDRVPVHFGATGAADGWVDKGPAAVLLPVGIVVFMAVCMTFAHVAIVRSKRGVDAGAPATTAWGYAMFARAQSVMLVATGVAFNLAFSLMPLQMAGVVSAGVLLAVMLLLAVATLVACVWMAVAYGQGGCRAAARLGVDASGGTSGDSRALSADDDRFWRAGVFYVNPDDPSLFVLKRFGIGWTLNWARPVSWAVMGGFSVLMVALLLLLVVVES